MPTDISEEKVKERAYEIYLERGGFDGDDQSDWFQAKAELVGGKRSGTTKRKKSKSLV